MWRPVEIPGGAEYRPSLLEASQLQLSQGPHTRPLPVEAGVEEGLAGVFFTSNNPKHCLQTKPLHPGCIERAHSGGYRIGNRDTMRGVVGILALTIIHAQVRVLVADTSR